MEVRDLFIDDLQIDDLRFIDDLVLLTIYREQSNNYFNRTSIVPRQSSNRQFSLFLKNLELPGLEGEGLCGFEGVLFAAETFIIAF